MALNSPVRLKEGRIENFSDFVNLMFEYGVFFKWIYFKNRPRGNLLFLRSALMVGTFSFVFFYFFYDFGLVLEGIEIDPVIALAGAVIIGYWHMTSSFYKKCKSCNQIHLEILKAAGKGDHKTVDILTNSLAIELLTLDLWAHRKFRNLFAQSLNDSLEFATKHPKDIHWKAPKDLKAYQELVNKGGLQAKEARLLLDHRHKSLMASKKEKATKKSAA